MALVGTFGLQPKATVAARAVPIALELQRRGKQVRVFVPPWDDPDSAGLTTEARGVPVEQVSLSGGPLAVLARLARAVARFQPDLIHAFKPIGFSAGVAQLNVVRTVLPGRRLPLVVDGDDWEGGGGWNERRPFPGWARAAGSWQERWCYCHADAVTVASEELRSIVWSLGVQPSRVFAVPNGLTAPLAHPKPEEVEEVRRRHDLTDQTILLYTRFAEFAPSWPVAFMAALRRSSPEVGLLVVGRGLAGEEEKLAAEARSAGLAQALRYVGWVQPDRLPSYLAAAHVAVVPFEDTLVARTKSSVKLLELMSLGLPIVASAVGENVRYLDYGRAGVLVPPPLDAEQCASEVQSLLSDAPRRERLGQAAAQRLREEYLWSNLANQVEDAYRRAVSSRGIGAERE
ncbi:MAG: glycosyltransferase family 4 protein [Anaerolineae bacterium]|nr:glycosyltransferase family 4 protein [Anaerolineae bacterium]